MDTPTKAQVRRRLRAARAQLSQQEVSRRGEQLAQILLGQITYDDALLGYLPMVGEPDLRPFLTAHLERGGEVFVPVIADPVQRLLNWARWTPQTQLRRSRYAPVNEPTGEGLTVQELTAGGASLLVPALAVDTSGARLGQGGGFYDTLFGAWSTAPLGAPPGSANILPTFAPEGQCGLDVLAVVHSEEILPAGSFPVEEHDLRVPRAATETGLVMLAHDELGGNPV